MIIENYIIYMIFYGVLIALSAAIFELIRINRIEIYAWFWQKKFKLYRYLFSWDDKYFICLRCRKGFHLPLNDKYYKMLQNKEGKNVSRPHICNVCGNHKIY